MIINRTLIHNAGNRVTSRSLQIMTPFEAVGEGGSRSDDLAKYPLIFQFTPSNMIATWGFPNEEEQIGGQHPTRAWVYSFNCSVGEGEDIKFLVYSCEKAGYLLDSHGGPSAVFFLKDNEGNFNHSNRVDEILSSLNNMHPDKFQVEEVERKIDLS